MSGSDLGESVRNRRSVSGDAGQGIGARLRAEARAFVAITAYHADALVLKSPSSVIAFAVRPLSFLFLVVVISRGQLLSTAVVGALVAFVTGVGMADLPIELAGMKRRSQFYDLFRSLPVSRFTTALAITVGQSLPGLLYGVLLVGVLTVVEGLGPVAVGAVVLIAATLWIWGALAGYTLGAWLEKPIVVRRATTTALVIGTTLAPVYYPLELLPPAGRTLAFALPTVSAAYLLRWTFSPLPMRPLAVIDLAVAVAAFGVLALRIDRR